MINRDRFYDAKDVEGKYMEVVLQDSARNEYVYWYNLRTLPTGKDEHDHAIEEAKRFHASKGLPEIPEDSEASEPYAVAYEPFSRYASEFAFIDN